MPNFETTKPWQPTPPKSLLEWADLIDNRIGPITGANADAMAEAFRAAAAEIDRLRKEAAQFQQGYAEARRQAANLMGHFIVDEGPDDKATVKLAGSAYDAIMKMKPNPEDGRHAMLEAQS